jgi:hypothetical protein
LRLHAGWSETSDVIEVYRSEKGGEECQDILRLAYNIDVTDKKQQQELEQELKGKLSIFDSDQESYPIINFHDFSIINLMGRLFCSAPSNTLCFSISSFLE